MPLRIVARRTPARARVVLDALARQGIPPAPDVSYFSDVGRDGGGRQRYKLETGTRDLFLATSWRSAAACRATSFAPRTTWLVRDDEAALLPAGDDRALCEALLADDSIDFAVETRELFDALAARYPAVARNGIPYEPAFPRPAPEAPATAGASTASTTAGRRRRLLFVARPEEPATLYALGLAALDRALADGVLDPAAWEFLCIGSPAPVLRFSDGTRATVLDPDRKGYDELLSGVDLILAPHATARTGGIALEAAAHGAVVVSTRASATPGPAARRGPVAAEPTVDALVAALRAGAALVDDPARRAVADAPEAWESGFAAVLVRFAERAAHA